jgi:hypothetical protein
VIESDQDLKFTSAFWMHFSRKVGKETKVLDGFPFPNGWKTERVNGVLNQYLRNLDQGVVFHGGLWSALQPTSLALEVAHSTLEFYHDGKELA